MLICFWLGLDRIIFLARKTWLIRLHDVVEHDFRISAAALLEQFAWPFSAVVIWHSNLIFFHYFGDRNPVQVTCWKCAWPSTRRKTDFDVKYHFFHSNPIEKHKSPWISIKHTNYYYEHGIWAICTYSLPIFTVNWCAYRKIDWK